MNKETASILAEALGLISNKGKPLRVKDSSSKHPMQWTINVYRKDKRSGVTNPVQASRYYT